MTRAAVSTVALGVMLFGHGHAQSPLEYEQGDAPALFEEVDADEALAIGRSAPWLATPTFERTRILKVRTDLLRPVAPGEEPYPIYLNLFPDVGFRIYVYRQIERDTGPVWLASPDPVYDGRRFIEIDSNSYLGRVGLGFDPRALGLGSISVVGVEEPGYLAVVEYAASALTWQYPYRPSASTFLLSKSSNSFSAETSGGVDHTALDFSYPEESVGYFITIGGDRPHPLPAKLYKTEDGGTHWQRVADALPGTPTSIYFSTATEGYAWLNATCDGVPCGYRLLKTSDSGATWTRMGEPVLGLPPGQPPSFVDARIDGALFAIFGRRSQNPGRAIVLARSDDGGDSWSELLTLPVGELDVFVAATAFGDTFYVGYRSGTIYAIDPVLGTVETIEIGTGGLWDFAVVSERVFVASVLGTEGFRLVRSTDRGASWTTVIEGLFKLIAAPSPDELLVIVTKERIGPADSGGTLDVVAYSADGGKTWEESEPTVSLVLNGAAGLNTGRQSVNGAHRLLLGDRVLTVRIGARD